FRAAGITELTNAGVWLTRTGDRLLLGGVDDLWEGSPDADLALGDATAQDACLLVSHNPDFAEHLRDDRVGLVLAGHTHGGQGASRSRGSPRRGCPRPSAASTSVAKSRPSTRPCTSPAAWARSACRCGSAVGRRSV